MSQNDNLFLIKNHKFLVLIGTFEYQYIIAMRHKGPDVLATPIDSDEGPGFPSRTESSCREDRKHHEVDWWEMKLCKVIQKTRKTRKFWLLSEPKALSFILNVFCKKGAMRNDHYELCRR